MEERHLSRRDLAKIRRRIAKEENDPTEPPLTIEEAQVWLLDWLASLGHKVEYN